MSLEQWGVGNQRVYVEAAGGTPSGGSQPGGTQAGGSDSRPWLIVIHGGAWRDPRITYESGFGCFAAAKASGKFGGYASVDYRLSPEVRHPAHLLDVKGGIEHVIKKWAPPSLVLLGHSCGAFLAGQVYPYFADKVKQVICLEGIYDLYDLVAEYPSYASFVEPAFGPQEEASGTSGTANGGSGWPRIDWVRVAPLRVLHSRGDELLSMRQPKLVCSQTGTLLEEIPAGKHDEVFLHPPAAVFGH